VLIVTGSVLSVPAAALWPTALGPATSADFERRDLVNLLLIGCLALLGAGAAVLSVAGPRPLEGRNVRIGLGTLATGLLGMLVSSIIPIPGGSNSLESWPYVVSAAIGLLATAIGTLVTVLSLARAPGPSRRLAGLFLAIALQPLEVIAHVLAAFGGIAMVLAVATLGVLAARGDRFAPGDSP
jgi:hypothetical protein